METKEEMDQIIVNEVILNCSQELAFEMFTKNSHLEKWLTTKAEVEPMQGGRYELFWNPADRENNSTIGCKVLAIEKPLFINFEWKGAVQHKHFMNNKRPLTNVSVIFIPKQKQTLVLLFHTGWGNSDEWKEALEWFRNAWKSTFTQLEKLVNETK